MTHELEARERQDMLEEIDILNHRLSEMEADWRECARTGKSPCFYCANDETCACTNDADCNFKWQAHN